MVDLTHERIAELVRESGFVNHLSDSFKDWCDPPDYCRRCLRAALSHVLAREADLKEHYETAQDMLGEYGQTISEQHAELKEIKAREAATFDALANLSARITAKPLLTEQCRWRAEIDHRVRKRIEEEQP